MITQSFSGFAGALLESVRARRHDAVLVIARGAALTFAITVGGMIAAYGVQLLLARWMGMSAYGSYVYVWSWASLLAVPATLGLPYALVRFIPQYQSERDMAKLRGILRYSVLAVLGCGLAMAIGSSGIALWYSADYSHAANLALALWAIPLITLVTMFSESLRAAGRVVAAFAPIQLLRPVVLTIAAFLIVINSGALSLSSAIAATYAAFLVTLTIEWLIFRRAQPAELCDAVPAYDSKIWLHVALPLGAASALHGLLEYAPNVIIGLILNPTDVGIYYVAARLAALVSLVILAVNALAAPAFSSFHWRNERYELESLVAKLSHLIFWPSLAIALLVIVFARPLLGLFGAGFVAGRPVMMVLIVGQLINAATGSVATLLQMTGHQLATLNALIFSAAANVILNLILAPILGCIGAAIAWTLTTALWKIWLHVLVTRHLDVHPSIIHALVRPQPQVG